MVLRLWPFAACTYSCIRATTALPAPAVPVFGDSCASVRFQGAVQKPWVSGEISCCGQCVAALATAVR